MAGPYSAGYTLKDDTPCVLKDGYSVFCECTTTPTSVAFDRCLVIAALLNSAIDYKLVLVANTTIQGE